MAPCFVLTVTAERDTTHFRLIAINSCQRSRGRGGRGSYMWGSGGCWRRDGHCFGAPSDSRKHKMVSYPVKFIFALSPTKSESRMSIRAKPLFNPVKWKHSMHKLDPYSRFALASVPVYVCRILAAKWPFIDHYLCGIWFSFNLGVFLQHRNASPQWRIA